MDFDSYARHTPYPYSGNQYVLEALQKFLGSASGRFLEVGAGDGGLLRTLTRLGIMARFSEVIACDISIIRVERIRKELPNVRAEVADAMQLPLSDGSIDFVFSDQVIEHVPDDRRMAREIARVLRAGGFALVGSVLRQPGAWYFYRCNGRWTIDPTHLREYESLDEYCAVFSDSGLAVRNSFVLPIAYALSDLLLRLLLRSGIIKEDAMLHGYEKVPSIKSILRGSIRIPRYFLCYAELIKPAS